MISKLKKYRDCSTVELSDLQANLEQYYASISEKYFETSFENYTNTRAPFHLDLVDQIEPQTSVLDYGCGSAHLAANLLKKNIRYTGLDWSIEQIEKNKQRFPSASFSLLGEPFEGQFDVVVSMHVIEHCVHPEQHLQTLWDTAKPGGKVAVLCPDFVNCGSFPKSIFYGLTPGRLSSKLKRKCFLDALEHFLDWKIRGPKWLRNCQKQAAGAFWINLAPKVLLDNDGYLDADAVHITRYEDIFEWFRTRGAIVLRTSKNMVGIPPGISKFNMYLLAQKPVTAG